MSRSKRWFITPYLLLVTVATFAGFFLPFFDTSAWFGLVFAAAPVTVLTIGQSLLPLLPRSPRRLWVFVALALAGIGTSATGWPNGGPLVSTILLTVGLLVYLYWHSEFNLPKSQQISLGQSLPEFSAWEKGKLVSSKDLAGQGALVLFYRGNWCPVCTAQITELSRSYNDLASRGIQVILVSPQNDQHSKELARKHSLPFRFWEDRECSAAKQLGILDPAGLPLGMETLEYGVDTPIPTALLINSQGKIIYSDQAENYRVRPEPREYLQVWDAQPSGV